MGTLNINSNEQFNLDLAEYKANFNERTQAQIVDVMTNPDLTTEVKLSKVKELSLATADNAKGLVKYLLLFDGKLYEVPQKSTSQSNGTSRQVNREVRFKCGDHLKLKTPHNESEEYIVNELLNVVGVDSGETLKPSQAVCKFFNKPMGSMAGFSHPAWIRTEQITPAD
ncbi:MAG: hypothetical protein ACYC2U_04650 [Candidatus Amoebophilus sp.]